MLKTKFLAFGKLGLMYEQFKTYTLRKKKRAKASGRVVDLNRILLTCFNGIKY